MNAVINSDSEAQNITRYVRFTDNKQLEERLLFQDKLLNRLVNLILIYRDL